MSSTNIEGDNTQLPPIVDRLLQAENQKSDSHLRPRVSASFLRENLRKAVKPLRVGTWITGLVRLRPPSRKTGEESSHAGVDEPMEGQNDASFEGCTADMRETSTTHPTNDVEAVDNQESSVDESEPYEGLATLPLDLLIEILKYLNWWSILQLRKICRALYITTTTKAVWLHLNVKLGIEFERPFRLMTAQDLQNAYLQRKGVPLGWTRNGIRRTRQRDVVDETAETFHLVPGGRWLLVATLTGSVSCYDLDHPDTREHELIPDQVRWKESNAVLMEVDVDREEELLTFTLVMSIQQRNESRPLDSKNTAFIWKVKLQLDEEGRGVCLRATKLVVFALGKHGCVQALSILGSRLCYRMSSSNRRRSNYFAIVDWTRRYSSHSEGVKEQDDMQVISVSPRRIIYGDENPAKMRLLPGNKLIVASNQGVKVYHLEDLVTLRDTQTTPRHQTPSAPQRRRLLMHIPSIIPKSLSRPFLVTSKIATKKGTFVRAKSLRLVVLSEHQGVCGLFFPLGDSWLAARDHRLRSISVIKLMDYTPGPFDCDYALGYNRAVVRGYLPQVDLLRYSWPDDVGASDPTILSKRIVCERWHRATPAMAENIGRIVISSNGGARLVILDTSLYDTLNSTTM